MATYTRISPATLANILAVIDDPLDTEAANKLAQVDLQTRRFVYDFLITKFDATSGKLLTAAVDAATTLAGTVSGSTSNAGTQRQVVQGTISTPDLRADAVETVKILDAAVTAGKLASDAVTTVKILNANVTEDKVATGAITAAKLGTAAVTTVKILDANVTTAKIADVNVTTGKIADNAVTGAKMVVGSAAGQLLITGTTPFTFAVQTVSGDATLSSAGVLTLSTKGIVEVEEQASLNTAAGGSSATTWNSRGVTRAWVKTFDTLSSTFLTISTEKLVLLAGTYIIEASAPAYTVGTHQLRLNRYNSGNTTQQIIPGSSETAGATTQSRSFVRGLMVFASGDYLKLQHFTTSAVATNGLGLPTNAVAEGGETLLEIYAQVRIQKVA